MSIYDEYFEKTDLSVEQVIVDISNIQWRVKPSSSGQIEDDEECQAKIARVATNVPLFDRVEIPTENTITLEYFY